MPALSLTDLPAKSPNLYVARTDGIDVGIGTGDELRDLAEDGILPADGLTFALAWYPGIGVREYVELA